MAAIDDLTVLDVGAYIGDYAAACVSSVFGQNLVFDRTRNLREA